MNEGGKWGSIALAVRTARGSMDGFFFRCWQNLVPQGMRHGDKVLSASAEILPHYAANYLTELFLQSNADTICFMDDDMIFTPDILDLMRDDPAGEEYDILQAATISRRPPHRILYWPVSGEDTLPPKGATGILPMKQAGLGFTFIRRNVFEVLRMEQPNDNWFAFPSDGRGEDIYFCAKASDMGFKIGINMAANVGHRFPMMGIWNSEESRVEFQAGCIILKPINKNKGEAK